MTTAPGRLAPFAALSASYFAHVGFFNPYLPLWLKDLGLSLLVIGLLTSVPAATRLFAPYAWGTLSDRTGERVKLLRWGAGVALIASLGLWLNAGTAWLAVVLLLMFSCTSAMSPLSEVAIAQAVSKNGVLDVRRYGRVRLWGSLGFMVTVFVAGAWFDHFGVRHFPMWTSLTSWPCSPAPGFCRIARRLYTRVKNRSRSGPFCGGGLCGGFLQRRFSTCWRTSASTCFSRCIWIRWAMTKPPSA